MTNFDQVQPPEQFKYRSNAVLIKIIMNSLVIIEYISVKQHTKI